MKSKYLIICLLATITFISCKKEDVIKVSNVKMGDVNIIDETTAVVESNIVELGHNAISIGHCWGTNSLPTVDDFSTEIYESLKVSSFTTEMTGLKPNTEYFVRAYILEEQTVIYSEQEISFYTTDYNFPVIQTEFYETYVTYVNVGGNVLDNGGPSILMKGICWSSEPSPTIESNYVENAEGNGSFPINIAGLVGGSKYYIRAFATTENGTYYGDELTFSTLESSFENFVAGNSETGKTWVLDSLTTGHLGVGSIDGSTGAEWWVATPMFFSDANIYDDEINFRIENYAATFNNNGRSLVCDFQKDLIEYSNPILFQTYFYIVDFSTGPGSWEIIEKEEENYLTFTSQNLIYPCLDVGAINQEYQIITLTDYIMELVAVDAENNKRQFRLILKGYISD